MAEDVKEDYEKQIEDVVANLKCGDCCMMSSSCYHVQDFEVEKRAKRGLYGLLKNKNAKVILSRCVIGDDGAILISKLLAANTACTQLLLPRNDISDVGAAAIATALKGNKSLTKLNLKLNMISDVGAATIVTSLRENKLGLDIAPQHLPGSYKFMTEDEKEDYVQEIEDILPNFKDSDDDSEDDSEDYDSEADGGWKKFVREGLDGLLKDRKAKVNLEGCDLGDDGAILISKFLAINTLCAFLNLKENNISSVGAAAIAASMEENKTLNELILRENIICDDGANALADCLKNNSTLQKLDLQLNKIGKSGILAFDDAVKTSGSHLKLDIEPQHIPGTYLFMTEDVKEDYGQKIEDFLANFTFDNPRNKDGLYRLFKNNSAEVGSFSWCDIGNDGAILVAKLLAVNTACATLRIGGSSIGEEGAKALATSLKTNRTLQTLYLDNNPIGDGGAKALATSLKTNTTLEHLSLPRNSIGDEGAEAFATSLKTNRTLQELRLTDNKIGTAGILAFANAIKTADRYLELYLEKQRTDDGGTTKNTWIIHLALKRESLLGSGFFGQAHLGQFRGDQVVLKSAHATKSPESLYETLVLSVLPPHDNLVQLHGICNDLRLGGDAIKRQVLVLALYGGGSLKSFVRKNPVSKTPLSRQLSYARQMTCAIQHLHANNLIHRDIALRNYVLSNNFETIVLIDFGLSFIVEQDDAPFYARATDLLPFRSLPPESMYKPHPYYKKSDIWMLGVTFWHMYALLFKTPFHDKADTYTLRKHLLDKMVTHQQQIPLLFPSTMPQEMKDLTIWCCNFDHKQRPTATELIQKIDDLMEKAINEESKSTELDDNDGISSDVIEEAVGVIEEYGNLSGIEYVDAPIEGVDAPIEYVDAPDSDSGIGYVDAPIEGVDAPIEYVDAPDSDSGGEEENKGPDLSGYFLDYESKDGPSDYYMFSKEVEDEGDFDEILQKYRQRTNTFPSSEIGGHQEEDGDGDHDNEESHEVGVIISETNVMLEEQIGAEIFVDPQEDVVNNQQDINVIESDNSGDDNAVM